MYRSARGKGSLDSARWRCPAGGWNVLKGADGLVTGDALSNYGANFKLTFKHST